MKTIKVGNLEVRADLKVTKAEFNEMFKGQTTQEVIDEVYSKLDNASNNRTNKKAKNSLLKKGG